MSCSGALPCLGGLMSTFVSISSMSSQSGNSPRAGGVESRPRLTMDAVATAAAARSLMTERVDRRRRMVIIPALSNKCYQCRYFARKRRDKLIEFRRRNSASRDCWRDHLTQAINQQRQGDGGALYKGGAVNAWLASVLLTASYGCRGRGAKHAIRHACKAAGQLASCFVSLSITRSDLDGETLPQGPR